jgi:hypothetical protein
MSGEVAALRKVLAQQAIGRSYVLSSRLAERVRRVRRDGGGLDEAVETAGKNALQTPANVAVGFAFGAASCFVVAGIFMAAEPGDRDGVESTIEVPVASAAQPVPGALAAAGLERGDPSQRCECSFAADTAAVGPADQKLSGDDGADAGFGEQRRHHGHLTFDIRSQADRRPGRFPAVRLSHLEADELPNSGDP